MPVLHVSVAGKTATYRQREGAIVCGNNDYRIAFTFDEEWAGYTNKTARFIWGGTYYDVDFTGDEVAVPVIPDATEVIVGLYVGELIRTTTMASIPCWPSVTSGGEQPNPGYGGQYVEEIRAAAARAEGAANAAEGSATAAAGSATAAQAAATTAGAAKTDAQASATAARTAEANAQTSATSAEEAAEAAEVAKTETQNALSTRATVGETAAIRKRVTNLEQGLSPDPFVADDTAAHVKQVPLDALSYAMVNAIGGMTHKEETTLRDTKVTALISAAADGTELARITIPAAVQALDGYGWGLSAKLYNGVEWGEDGRVRFVKRVGRRVYSAADFPNAGGSDGLGYYQSAGVSPSGQNDMLGSTVLCNKLPSGVPKQSGGGGCYISGGVAVFFPGDYASTAAEWRAKLAEWEAAGDPLVLYYLLTTPVVTDVSHLVTADNMIQVEAGGTLTAENANSDAAATVITYEFMVGGSIEDVSAALDEIHTYAQDIIAGGAS